MGAIKNVQGTHRRYEHHPIILTGSFEDPSSTVHLQCDNCQSDHLEDCNQSNDQWGVVLGSPRRISLRGGGVAPKDRHEEIRKR